MRTTFASIDHTIANLNMITTKMNNSEGTIGMLLNNKDLYINLSNTAASADKLLIDLQKSPKSAMSIFRSLDANLNSLVIYHDSK